jgi:hypothetical protein
MVRMARRETRTTKLRWWLRRRCYGLAGFLRDPRRATCRECGFFAFDGREVQTWMRIELSQTFPASRIAHPENLDCFRSMWTWPLYYASADAHVINEELETVRRGCEGFFRYRPGFSPAEHRDLTLKRSENRRGLWLMFLSAIVGGLVTYGVSHLK